MPRPKKLRAPTAADVKRIDPTHPKTLGVKRMLDDAGLLQRSPSVDKFIISELARLPSQEVDRRYVTPTFPHDPVDDPFNDWYRPGRLDDLCKHFGIPKSTFNRLRITFFVTDVSGGEMHYPIMLGRTLWRAMNRLKLTSLRETVDYYNTKRAETNASRRAQRKDSRTLEDMDELLVVYETEVAALKNTLEATQSELSMVKASAETSQKMLSVTFKVIGKLRARLTPEQQAALDRVLVKAGITPL